MNNPKRGIERLEGFNFFELHNPYYALIKAKTNEEAVRLYIELVAGDDSEIEELRTEIKEVDKYYALGKFYGSYHFALSDVGINETLEEYFEHVLKEESTVMLIDGSLL